MKITTALILTGLVASLNASAQTLTLDECRQQARDNYPAIRQYGLMEKTRDYNVANIGKSWLPQLSITAGAYAMTDILQSTPQTSAIGMGLDNKMASASITVTQSIYDGGQIQAGKRVAEAQYDVQARQLDVSMYSVYERVHQLFFGILLIDEQLRQNTLLSEDLSISMRNVSTLMDGGLANQSDVDAISVEQLKAEQQRIALSSARDAYLLMLGTMTGRELGGQTVLQMPSDTEPAAQSGVGRPEMGYYDSMNSLLDQQQRQLNTQLRPTVSFFGIGMTHTRMGSLMNKNVLLGGLTLSWNIDALYTRKADRNKLKVQRMQNESQRETFLFNNRLENLQSNGNIESLRRQIEKDDEIVRLRERIRQTCDKKVSLGTESVNELLRQVNAASQARQTRALHRIQLLQEVYNLKNINNK